MKKSFPPDQGVKIKWGFFKEAVPAALLQDDSPETAARRQQLRDQAAKDLVNIDAAERDRRKLIGVAAALTAAGLAVVLGVNDVTNPLIRAIVLYVPVAVCVGFLGSARIGLCGIGQGGAWDVDGTGVCTVPDRNVAVAIKKKTDDYWLKVGITAVSVDLIIACAPLLLQQ